MFNNSKNLDNSEIEEQSMAENTVISNFGNFFLHGKSKRVTKI